ncbi:hypothetical protein CEB3_c33280 [Peptococcaceae bacterium CEB3]|nr:hypothetical protein CEB3_c33280 [Peptococcaceae bacterium CEB3]
MRNIIYSEVSPGFLIQGLGLHPDGESGYAGKIGRNEIMLLAADHRVPDMETEGQVFEVGLATGGNQFRAGDILMLGSDELLDRMFQAMDEMEQRGVVVSLSPSDDPTQIYLDKEAVSADVRSWRERKVPFICLWVVEPLGAEAQAKLVTLVRRMMN